MPDATVVTSAARPEEQGNATSGATGAWGAADPAPPTPGDPPRGTGTPAPVEEPQPTAGGRPLRVILGVALAMGLVAGGGAALAKGDAEDPAAAAAPVASIAPTSTTPRATSTTSTTTTPTAAATAPAPAPAPVATSPTTAAPVVAGPAITSFTAEPTSVECDAAGSSASLVLSWSVTGADAVALSADGSPHGSFSGDPGSVTVPYSCPGPHTYTLVATTGGGSASKSVTVTA